TMPSLVLKKAPIPPAAPMTNNWNIPTILLSGSAVCQTFVYALQHRGYLVLESQSDAETLELVRLQSRSIHVMITDEGTDGRSLAQRLRPFRPQMQVLFVNWDASENTEDTIAPRLALPKVEEILNANRTNRTRHAGVA